MASIDRTITTYTFLESLRESGISQLDLYIPLVCHTIVKHAATEVSRDELKEWFSSDYGMSSVYQGVFDTLLKKMKGKYLVWKSNKYVVNMPEIAAFANQHQERDLSEAFGSLFVSVKRYAQVNFEVDLPTDEIQAGLLDILHSRDGDLLFQQDKTLNALSKTKEGKTQAKKLKYILSQFVLWSKNSDYPSFELLVKMAKGHALTSIVTMKDVASYVGMMKQVIIALDAPIVFNLLGLNYKTNLELEKELLGVLHQQGVNFVIFQEHYQEIKQSISSSINLLYTKNYDLDKASRLLRYSVRNHISIQELRMRLQQLDSTLEKYHISVVSAPESQTGYQEIDMQLLESLLVSRYSNGEPEKLDEIRRKIIGTDVDVISYIYRLRGRNVATNLKNCTAMLVTTNTALAYASKHPKLSDITHAIPVCLTDTFLSTTLWFNYPNVKDDVNEKVLISECYKNITLSDEILQRFYTDVERLNADAPLTEEQMLNVKTSEVVMEMLENKTFNDTTLYTDMTTAEILEELERKRNAEIDDKTNRLARITDNSFKRSRQFSTVIYFVIWTLLVFLFSYVKFIDLTTWDGWGIVINILVILPSLWGLFSWGGFIWPKANVVDWIANKVYNVIYKGLDK